MWRQAAIYGLLLALGTTALQWLDYQRLARVHLSEVYIALIAAAFLVLGLVIGVRLMRTTTSKEFDGNPKVQATLGITERELTVLQALAEGRSNKEIAAKLHVSPNTIKTHLARLFEKLGAKRRTDAINRARELGILQ